MPINETDKPIFQAILYLPLIGYFLFFITLCRPSSGTKKAAERSAEPPGMNIRKLI
jgi:hypothetical protein